MANKMKWKGNKIYFIQINQVLRYISNCFSYICLNNNAFLNFEKRLLPILAIHCLSSNSRVLPQSALILFSYLLIQGMLILSE